MLLDVAHGGIDLRADVLGFGAVEQVIEPCLGGQIQDALGVISRRIVNPRTAARAVPVPTFGAGFLQLGALGGEADFGEAQEDEAEDGRGVFLGYAYPVDSRSVWRELGGWTS